MASGPDLRLLAASRDRALTPEMKAAVAQLSAACDIDLTVAHVASRHGAAGAPGGFDFDVRATPRRIQRREVAGPDAAGALARLCADEPFDLVLAPAGRDGIPWPLRRSLRERLLRRAATPVWTAGPDVSGRHFDRPLRSVACLLDFDASPERLLQRAGAFARRLDAHLHLLAVVPPIDDGTLAVALSSDTPLLPSAAIARIEEMCAGRPAPAVDVVIDGLARGLRRLVDVAAPDLLFVRARQWTGGLPFGFSRPLDRLRCPVICVPDETAVVDWTFERSTAATMASRAARVRRRPPTTTKSACDSVRWSSRRSVSAPCSTSTSVRPARPGAAAATAWRISSRAAATSTCGRATWTKWTTREPPSVARSAA